MDVSLAGLEVLGLERGRAEGKCPQGLSNVGSGSLLGAEAVSQGEEAEVVGPRTKRQRDGES